METGAIARAHSAARRVLTTRFDFEFRCRVRQHKNADRQFVVQFYGEWRQYLNTVLTQKHRGEERLGADLDERKLSLFNDEQREALAKLREAAIARKDD